MGTYAQRANSGSDLFCLRPSKRFWINLQIRYDLEVEKDWLGAALDDIQPWVPRADANADYQLEQPICPPS